MKREVELSPYTFSSQGSPKPRESPKLIELGGFKRIRIWSTMALSACLVFFPPPHFILLFVMNIT